MDAVHDDYLTQILTAQVYDVAIESPLELAPQGDSPRHTGNCRAQHCGAQPLAEGVYEFPKRHHLPATGGRWHDDQRVDAGLIPGFNPCADFRDAAVECDLLEPAIRHECEDFMVLLVGNGLPNGQHLFLKTRL